MLRHIQIGLLDLLTEEPVWRWERRSLTFESGMVLMTRVWRARFRLVKKLQCGRVYVKFEEQHVRTAMVCAV
jgi:hypothetical protein